MRKGISKSFRLIFCGLIIMGLSVIAFAQFKAGIQGTVTDNNGGVIPEATVTLVSLDTNQTQKTIATDSGFYRFSGLAPGKYRITAEKDGFKKKVLDNFVVNAEQLQGLDVILDAGVISETVTVEAGEQALQTEDANIRKSITTQDILALPQSGRDPFELARLAPGVFGTGARDGSGNSQRLPNTSGPGGSNNSIFATENVQPISANGQRVSSNNYQIDGTSVNSQTWGGGAVITPSQESVKEFIVTSSTYSAEDGRNSGAQLKVVSQNGTNQWHGSGFFKIDDPRLNAFNQMPTRVGTLTTSGPQRVERKYQSYGGSFGGPILRDRLFFFFTYEGLKENSANTFNSLIETSAWRSAVIASRPNSISARVLQSAGIEPRVVQIIAPVSNGADNCEGIFVACTIVGNGMDIGSIFGTNGSYVPFSQATVRDGVADVQWAQLASANSFRGNQFNTRIDYQMTEKDKLTFTSYFVPNSATVSDNNAQSRPQADINSERLQFLLGFIYNRNISSTMTNEARVNITRWGYDETESNPGADLGLPRIEIEGFFSNRLRFGFPRGLNTPGVINEKQIDIRDTLTWVRGNHILKIGGEYRRDLNSNGEVGGARPLYSFHRLWNFANNTPIFEEVSATLNGQPTANNTKFTTSEMAFFVQDDWKFRPNLTLNMGLRWSYYSPVTASNGVLGNLQLDANGGLAGARIVTNKELYKKDWNNFGPQLGFAWSPNMFDSKLVIRGGGGMGFDRLPNALLANARRNTPNGALFGICCGGAGAAGGEDWATPFVGGLITYVASSDGTIFGYPANPNLGGGTNAATGLPNTGSAEIYGSPQDLDTAYVFRYSLEGQYELSKNVVATIGYSGSQGRHFVRILPLHIMTTTNPRIGAAYFASGDVNSSYNAMITRLQGRFMNQFSFDANYRWSKSIDTSSFESPCACTNQSFPVDQKEERGPSDFDVAHAITGSATWDSPFFRDKSTVAGKLLGGWQISGITTWNSGFPWTPRIFGCLNGNTTSSNQFCDPRPSSYTGLQPAANSNENFLRQFGVFGVAGSSVFGTAYNSSNPFQSRPGVGRNSFRGPRYFTVDMTVAKKFALGSMGFLGENANIDVRFNFFNVFNTLNLAPFNALTDNIRVNAAQFGTATNGLSGRVGEFQIRFSF
ncbi:MAG: TonB-dependent receptor [Acidobacteriota bacterium]